MHKKSNSALFIIVVMLIGIVGISIFSPEIFIQADPTYHTGIPLSDLNNLNCEHHWDDVWSGNNYGAPGFPTKELIDDTKYVTSWKTSGVEAYSEKIVAQGMITENALFETAAPQRGCYRIYIKTSGSNWQKIGDENGYDNRVLRVSGGSLSWQKIDYNSWQIGDNFVAWAQSIVLQLIGPYVGAIKVEYVVEFSCLFNTWRTVMSRDYAYLISGNGKINIAGHSQTDVPMFENGDTVPIQVSCDYSGPTVGESGRWELWAFPLDGRSGRLLTTFSDYTRTTYEWKLPDDAWVRGTSDSKWTIELRNTLFSQDEIMLNTIDVRANAPPTPTVTVDKKEIYLGDKISVTISGEINPITNESIAYYWVRGIYFDNNQQFLYTKSTSGMLTVTPPREGKMYIQVWSHDVAGRETENPAQITITVLAPQDGQEPIPSPILPGDIMTWVLIIVVIIAIVGIGLYAYQKKGFRRKK